ncbi:MAG: hypothetical protein Q9220_000851 [cf. Caloplaca sp. 1 TL-2023]
MEGSSPDHPASKAQTINLNVLSPSTEEIPQKLIFSDIAISTTVRVLKERIQNTVSSRPSLPRQRLIYQGKVLASDEASLKDIFGQDAIDRLEPLSLHLVLSPTADSHTSAPSTSAAFSPAQQSHGRPQWTPSLVPQPQHIVNGQPLQHNQQGTVPNAPQPPGQFPPGFNPQAFHPPTQAMQPQQGQPPLPPHLQQAMNSHLAALNQQLTAQYAAHGQQHVHQGHPHFHVQPQQWQQPAFAQPTFQQIIAQQQQARAAAGQHGLNQTSQNNQGPREQNAQAVNNSQVHPPMVPNTNTVVRENQGPNGESFRMVIQSTSISRPNSRMSQHRQPHSAGHTPQRSSTPANTSPQVSPSINASANGNPSPHDANTVVGFQQRLSSMEMALALGTVLPQTVFDQARTQLDNMARQPNTLPTGLEAPLRSRLNLLTTQADQLRASQHNAAPQMFAGQQAVSGMMQANLHQVMPAMPFGMFQPGQLPAQATLNPNTIPQATQTGTTSTSTQQATTPHPAQTFTEPDIYLLSSPAGPHSLLVTPTGSYTTPFTLPMMAPMPQYQPQFLNQPIFSPPIHFTQHPNPQPQAHPANQNQPQAPVAFAQVFQQQHQQQQQRPQAANQAQPQPQNPNNNNNNPRDLARILLPLGGHLWLLIRLFGFVYFFTAGGGQRRAFLLGICAFIVFIANTGAFRPVVRAVWEPVRRHVEGLVPLAAAGGDGGGRNGERGQVAAPQQQQQRRGGDNAIQQGQARNDNAALPASNDRNGGITTTPEELAARLLRERQSQSLLRRAERAVALFVASLVPGVGERHIAARDAAEARRLEEEQEREVRNQMEREGQEEREMERQEGERIRRESLVAVGTGAGGSTSGVDAGGGGGASGGEGMREREGREASAAVAEG